MQSVFLVAYDVADDKRRTRLFNKLKGYGYSLQYSIFRCHLTPSQKLQLRSDIWPLLNQSTDRILLVDIGPDGGRGSQSLESWGKPMEDPAMNGKILIV